MNSPTPAIVAQGAVRRLPRLALVLFCLAYALPGFISREPWKTADIAAFGYMLELARGATDWFKPQLIGLAPEVEALLPYWLGAWAMQIAPQWIAADFASRIPFIFLLVCTMSATWYGTYYLARSPEAQPVAFAFGGEALPPDYARALADGGLLALIACLGLAQLSHETTPALAQLCFIALTFWGFSALPYRAQIATTGATLGLIGLTLSGAPTLAGLLGVGSAFIHLMDRSTDADIQKSNLFRFFCIGIITLCVMLMSTSLDLWRWRIDLPEAKWTVWRNLGRLLLWFTWPAWPLALWTLWRWRGQLIRLGSPSLHLAIPLWFTAVPMAATLTTGSADRSLLLTLPALAALAAFSLPTLKHSVSALIDWFTLIFFSGCAFIVWVVWIAMQTGVPAQPAANVARLAPGFEPSFSVVPFVIALLATFAWAWLVIWRVGRHRAAIWKSLVLPAGGAALCWLLLMTLWLPLLDFARSYSPFVHRTMAVINQLPGCAGVLGLNQAQIVAFKFHSKLIMKHADSAQACQWLIVDKDALPKMSAVVNNQEWSFHTAIRHTSDRNDDLLIYKRIDSTGL